MQLYLCFLNVSLMIKRGFLLTELRFSLDEFNAAAA